MIVCLLIAPKVRSRPVLTAHAELSCDEAEVSPHEYHDYSEEPQHLEVHPENSSSELNEFTNPATPGVTQENSIKADLGHVATRKRKSPLRERNYAENNSQCSTTPLCVIHSEITNTPAKVSKSSNIEVPLTADCSSEVDHNKLKIVLKIPVKAVPSASEGGCCTSDAQTDNNSEVVLIY